ncbi:hypothetical protein CDCA_CDCA19G4651 [Cyanidium caldarium]|uniref:Sirohydrochlorin cobaltochelatase n=1 Tax=Cyanidium caldarium TaxID=2771 RepID=A0AAV9J2L8_CYACA|nr:hypothetical protein CDCA_CDCA19G4651 [Cyanidium caldarium]
MAAAPSGVNRVGKRAILVVDHGSRRAEANGTLFSFIELLKQQVPSGTVIHGAHMEMAPPDIPEGFQRCVEDGAQHVTVVPYFLAPGKHSTKDIPTMAAESAARYPGVTFAVTPPLGVHQKIAEVVLERVRSAEDAASEASAAL